MTWIVMALLAIWVPARQQDAGAIEQARARLAGAREALAADEADAAREELRAGIEELLAAEGPAPAAREALLLELSDLARQAGALESSRQALQWVLDERERALPEDAFELQSVRIALASVLKELGDAASALTLVERVVAVFERTRPEEDDSRVGATMNLGNMLRELGRLEEACAVLEQVLAVRERTQPADSNPLQVARLNLANALRQRGEATRALALHEQVVAVWSRKLAGDDPSLLIAWENLGVTLLEFGDVYRAHPILLRALEAREARLPEEDLRVQNARINLAIALKRMGDLDGARSLEERVLAIRERLLPPDHDELAVARASLSETLADQGDLASARALIEKAIDTWGRTRPGAHPHPIRARLSLARYLNLQGEYQASREQSESTLEVMRRSLPDDDPYVLLARGNLARTLNLLGEFEQARALGERVLATLERSPSDSNDSQVIYRTNLCRSLVMLGDAEALVTEVRKLIGNLEHEARACALLSPRQAGEWAASVAGSISTLLSLALDNPDDVELTRALFDLTESVRAATAHGSPLHGQHPEDPTLGAARRKVLEARRRVDELASAAGPGADASGEAGGALGRAVLERDRAEAELRQAIAGRGALQPSIRAQALAARLPEGSAAVGYWFYGRTEFDPTHGPRSVTQECLLAQVLRPDGALVRVEIGPRERVDAAVAAWRQALGEPLGRGGSLGGPASPASADDQAAGVALRELVLDPVLRAAGEARELFVCADGALHLVALDALPTDTGLVGERFALMGETSFGRLLGDRPPAQPGGSLLAVGGVDFDQRAEERPSPLLAASAPWPARGTGPGGVFAALPGTLSEIEALGALFKSRFEREPLLLSGREATKRAVCERAVGMRFVHLATHGYFADEGVRSSADAQPARDGWIPLGQDQAVRGMAPMTLCGLALAGANLGREATGRTPGILTAEELAGVDLSSCDLAVLSACETNVGLQRAGQGVQSLQAALHASGARTAITSLWKVPDEATKELMADFYRRMWVEQVPKARALWEAKMALRDQRDTEGRPVHATRDWAGWVLTGDPR